MANDLADQIKAGFNALGGGVKEAGRKRVMELVDKQGYVGYRNADAAKLFKNNPEYANWECRMVDGEYRFYPPKKEDSVDMSIIETYKNVKGDSSIITRVSIRMLENGKCDYSLITVNKASGEQKTIQHMTIDAGDNFLKTNLPSLYYHLCSGLPVMDMEKDKNMSFMTFDSNDMLLLGNLSEEQKKMVSDIKKYVDAKQNLNIDDASNKTR